MQSTRYPMYVANERKSDWEYDDLSKNVPNTLSPDIGDLSAQWNRKLSNELENIFQRESDFENMSKNTNNNYTNLPYITVSCVTSEPPYKWVFQWDSFRYSCEFYYFNPKLDRIRAYQSSNHVKMEFVAKLFQMKQWQPHSKIWKFNVLSGKIFKKLWMNDRVFVLIYMPARIAVHSIHTV